MARPMFCELLRRSGLQTASEGALWFALRLRPKGERVYYDQPFFLRYR